MMEYRCDMQGREFLPQARGRWSRRLGSAARAVGYDRYAVIVYLQGR